jgi:hypothetical protein
MIILLPLDQVAREAEAVEAAEAGRAAKAQTSPRPIDVFWKPKSEPKMIRRRFAPRLQIFQTF